MYPTIEGEAALTAFRQKHLTGQAVLDLFRDRGAGSLLLALPVGVGKSWCLDAVTKAAVTTGRYELVIVLAPTRQLISEREPLRNPPAGVKVVNLRPRPRTRCGKTRDAKWRKLEASGLGMYGRKEVCGKCPARNGCFWPAQYGRRLEGAGIVYATQAHLERDPAFPFRVSEWAGGRKALTLLDENSFTGVPRDRAISHSDLGRYQEAVAEAIRTGHADDRLATYLDAVQLLPLASTTDLQDKGWKFPPLPAGQAAAVQEAGWRMHQEAFRYLGYDLARFADSPPDTRRASAGRLEYAVRSAIGDAIIFSGTADAVFTGHRLGTDLASPFQSYRFTHSDTRWYNIASSLGTRGHFARHAPQVLDFFAGLVGRRTREGKRVVLVSRKCFAVLCADGLQERFDEAGLGLQVVADRWTAERLTEPTAVPLITYGMIGTNLFEEFDAAYCLNGYYVNEDVVNRCLQDVTRSDLRVPIQITTGGRPRRRTAGVVRDADRYYDTAALAQSALEFKEHSVVVQAVGRVRPFTRPREVVTFQMAELPGVAYAAEFATLGQAREHFNVPSRRQAATIALANRIADLRGTGLTQANVARQLGVSEKTVRNHTKRSPGKQP